MIWETALEGVGNNLQFRENGNISRQVRTERPKTKFSAHYSNATKSKQKVPEEKTTKLAIAGIDAKGSRLLGCFHTLITTATFSTLMRKEVIEKSKNQKRRKGVFDDSVREEFAMSLKFNIESHCCD